MLSTEPCRLRSSSPLTRAVAVLAVVASTSGCAAVTTTLRQERTVIARRVEPQRSTEWSYRVSSRALDESPDPATAATFAAEVTLTRSRECWTRTTESVQTGTVQDREWNSPALPIVEFIVGGLSTIASAIAFSLGPASTDGPKRDDFHVTTVGWVGGFTGVVGVGGLASGGANLLNIIDRREDADPLDEVEESPRVGCEASLVVGAEITAVTGTDANDGRIVARATTDENGVAILEISRGDLAAPGQLRVRVGQLDVGRIASLAPVALELQRLAEADRERDRQARALALAASQRRENSCSATCVLANRGHFDTINDEPRVLDWMEGAFRATAPCRASAPRGACTGDVIRECTSLCVAAPLTDPTGVLPRRVPPSRSVDEAIASLRTEGVLGFRMGERLGEARTHCGALHGRLDESDLASEHLLVCNGDFAATIEGQPLPHIGSVQLRFCGSAICEVSILTGNAVAGRGGVLAYAAAMNAALTESYGHATSRETRAPQDTRRWLVRDRLQITSYLLVSRLARDMSTVLLAGDVFMVSFRTDATMDRRSR